MRRPCSFRTPVVYSISMTIAGGASNRRANAAAVSVVLAVHAGLAWLDRAAGGRMPWGDEKRYLESAGAVLRGDPSWWPVPLWPPLYPRFLAGILALSPGRGLVGIILVQTALLLAAAMVFSDLVREWTGDRTAGRAAFIMMGAFPALAAYGRFFWPEVLHLFLAMVVLWVLSLRRDRLGWLAVGGGALGLALLTKSLLGPFVPILLIGAFVGDRTPRRAGRIACFLAAAAIVVTPVIGMQYRRTGSAVIADSSAFNLWVGLNDRSRKNFEDPVVPEIYREYLDEEGTFAERNARLRKKSLGLIRRRGLVSVLSEQFGRQYFRLFDRECYLTEQLPGGAAAVDRAGYLGLNPAVATWVRRLSNGSYAVLLLAAPLGFALWPFKDRRWPRILLIFLFYNLAVFLFLHVKSRYRIQMLPVFFLGASGAVAWVRAALDGRRPPGPWLGKASFGGLIALGLLILAFWVRG